MIIGLAMNKGGTGKTTTAVNLSAALAALGKRCLLVDADGQASASRTLGIPRGELNPSLAEVLEGRIGVQEALRETGVPGLQLLTGAPHLADTDVVLAGDRKWDRRLRKALKPLRDGYDFIVIDSPPSFSLLMINVLATADYLLIPLTPQYLAVEGLENLKETLRRLDGKVRLNARGSGILFTIVDRRIRATREMTELIRDFYGPEVFDTEIPINARLGESPRYGVDIFRHDPSSPGALAYRALAGEFLERMERLRG